MFRPPRSLALSAISLLVWGSCQQPGAADFEGKFPQKGDMDTWLRASKIADKADHRLAAGDNQGAEKLYRAAIKMYPYEPVAYDALAKCILRMHKFKEAASLAQQSISMEPSFSNYNTLGIAYADQSKFAEAQIAFSKAEKLVRSQSDKQLLKANLAIIAKRQSRARANHG